MRALQRDADERRWAAWQALTPEERKARMDQERAESCIQRAEYADTKAAELRQEADDLRHEAAEIITNAYLLDRSPTGVV
jgi:hypothetical protein